MIPFQKILRKSRKNKHSHHQINKAYSAKPLDHVFVHMFSAYIENYSPNLKTKASMYVHK